MTYMIQRYIRRYLCIAYLMLSVGMNMHAQNHTTRRIVFENDFGLFFDLDPSLANLKPMVEGLTIELRSGNHSITSSTPGDEIPFDIVDNQISMTIQKIPTHILFELFPDILIEPLPEDAGNLDQGKMKLKLIAFWAIKKLVSMCNTTTNVTLHTTINSEEEIVPCTEIIVDFIDLAHAKHLGLRRTGWNISLYNTES